MGRRKQGEYRDEGDVKDDVKKVLRRYAPNLHWDMPPAGQWGKSGRHDFAITQESISWTIETKFGSNKPSDGQVDYARDMQAAGAVCLLINENNIWEVAMVADYIAANKRAPTWMNHAFKARRTLHKPRATAADPIGDGSR